MSTGRDAAFLEIMRGVDTLDTDPVTKRKFCNLVRSIGVVHGFAWIEREDQVAYARGLLALKVSRPTIRDRLIATFDVSRTQAYRIIGNALQLSQKRPKNGTPFVSNDYID